MEKKKGFNQILMAIVVSWLGCIGITGIIATDQSAVSYTNSTFAIIFFGLSVYFMSGQLQKYINNEARKKIYDSIFALVISVMLHFGAALEKYENVNFTDVFCYISILCLAVYLAPVVGFLFDKLPQLLKKTLNEEARPFKILQVWGLIFALWIPTFMAFFPGAFVYDATDEYVEVISRNFSMHHPLIHVLLLGGLTHLAEYLNLHANVGIAAYTVIQMAVLSLVFAYMIKLLQKWGLGKKYCLAVIFIVGLFPVYPMYAVCSAKDTYFSAAFLMTVLLSVEFIREKEKFFDKRMILYVACATLMMLLRNNGVYAFVVSIPFILILAKISKKDFKSFIKFVVLMIIAVSLYKGANYSLKLIFNADDSEHQEMLTVPIQQLARVYKYAPDTFSKQELETLYEVLPENYLITYNPKCSDVLKSGFDNTRYSSNPGKYKALWWNIAKKKPLIYINAWLVNSYGYWYPDAIINGYSGNGMYTFTYGDSSYFGFETEPPGERQSLFPLYEKFYRNISLEIFQQKVPVIAMLFAPGFLFMVFAFSFVNIMRERRWQELTVLIPVLLLWGTVLLGPTVLVRYVLILWFMVPLLPLAFVHKES